MRMGIGAILSGLIALSLGPMGTARADGPAVVPRVYDGVDAAWDSHFRAEARRRESIGRQLEANDAMAWYAGAPTTVPYPPDLETLYAYPPTSYRADWPGSPTTAYRGYPGVFEAWPFVPGDIYGYPYVDRVEQPRGHVVVPYGRGSYYYGPVYDRDLVPPPAPEPVPLQEPPAVVQPPVIAEPPAEASPQIVQPEAIPAPPPQSSRREF